MPGLDPRLHRDRENDEIDSAGRELIAKLHNRLDWIRLDRVGVSAVSKESSLKEPRAGHVIDVGPIEEPAVAAEIDLFVAGTEFHQRKLNPGEQPLGND